ncbi:uncharacterized protein LOC141630898 [Silene latifolia]|uniref:uncharacterized protein LOC141630898 n=1 Tax=Silene latifolia TaxID=37657 RepID=UPI003D77A06D
MAALFGYSNDRFIDENLSYRRKRSRSRGPDSPHKKSPSDEDGLSRSKYLQRHKGDREEKISTTENGHIKRRKTDKREHESSLRKKKEAYSSYNDSSGDSPLREKHTHDSRKRSKMKDEAALSDSSSGSRSGRDGSSRKRIRSISKSKNKSDYREYKRKSDSLERDEDRSHNHGRKSSRMMSVIDESIIRISIRGTGHNVKVWANSQTSLTVRVNYTGIELMVNAVEVQSALERGNMMQNHLTMPLKGVCLLEVRKGRKRGEEDQGQRMILTS